MDRRKVDDVEAHSGDALQVRLGFAERRAAGRVRSPRSREHFVPGAETGAFAIDPHRQHSLVSRGLAQIGEPAGKVGEPIVLRRARPFGRRGRAADEIGLCVEPSCVLRRAGSARAPGGLPEERGAFEQIARDVLTRFNLRHERFAP